MTKDFKDEVLQLWIENTCTMSLGKAVRDLLWAKNIIYFNNDTGKLEQTQCGDCGARFDWKEDCLCGEARRNNEVTA